MADHGLVDASLQRIAQVEPELLGKPPDPLGDIPIVVEDTTLAGSKGVTTTCSPAAN